MPSAKSPESAEELVALRRARLINKMYQFVNTHSAADFGGLAPPREQTQYKHSNRSTIKKKGGNPPADFFYVEEFIDLQLHLEALEYDEAIPLYFKLRRLVP